MSLFLRNPNIQSDRNYSFIGKSTIDKLFPVYVFSNKEYRQLANYIFISKDDFDKAIIEYVSNNKLKNDK